MPAHVYQMLVEQSAAEHRSISQQAVVLLSQALQAPADAAAERRKLLAAIAATPVKLDLAAGPTPEQLIAEDRER